jgi:hypothetical protein
MTSLMPSLIASFIRYAGIIELACSPVAVCKNLAVEMSEWTRAQFGAAPPIHVHGDPTHSFTYARIRLRLMSSDGI